MEKAEWRQPHGTLDNGVSNHMIEDLQHSKKFDDKSQKMVYFDVVDKTKEHKLYDPQHEEVHVSRYVVFKEV